jgi:hypothetical protein
MLSKRGNRMPRDQATPVAAAIKTAAARRCKQETSHILAQFAGREPTATSSNRSVLSWLRTGPSSSLLLRSHLLVRSGRGRCLAKLSSSPCGLPPTLLPKTRKQRNATHSSARFANVNSDRDVPLHSRQQGTDVVRACRGLDSRSRLRRIRAPPASAVPGFAEK